MGLVNWKQWPFWIIFTYYFPWAACFFCDTLRSKFRLRQGIEQASFARILDLLSQQDEKLLFYKTDDLRNSCNESECQVGLVVFLLSRTLNWKECSLSLTERYQRWFLVQDYETKWFPWGKTEISPDIKEMHPFEVNRALKHWKSGPDRLSEVLKHYIFLM